MNQAHDVGLKILRGLALGIDLPEDYFLEVSNNCHTRLLSQGTLAPPPDSVVHWLIVG